MILHGKLTLTFLDDLITNVPRSCHNGWSFARVPAAHTCGADPHRCLALLFCCAMAGDVWPRVWVSAHRHIH